MANFYLIDQSFRDESSHHADYVFCIAKAARAAGFQVVVGAHCRLKRQTGTEQFGAVRPCFHNTIYQRCSDLAGLRRMKRQNRQSNKNLRYFSVSGLLERFRSFRREREKESIIRQFTRDCVSFFRGVKFSSSDLIFLASVSELELVGLANFLTRFPQTMRPQWSAQFHFNLLEGRPPEYEHQAEITQLVRNRLMTALAPVSYHNLSLYATTDELTYQFNQLGIGHFETLSYPIAPEFALHNLRSWEKSSRQAAAAETKLQFVRKLNVSECQLTNSDESAAIQETSSARLLLQAVEPKSGPSANPRRGPLRVVCPGAIRREKGQGEYLPELIQQAQANLLTNRQIQLVVQKPDKKFGERDKLRLPDSLATADCRAIEIVAHPLPRSEYVELIRRADVGLLYYDSKVYYSRRAGILGELLAAGKPVIVPAGCWLAEQVAEPIFSHVDQCIARSQHRVCTLADLRWGFENAPMHGGIINFDQERRPFRFETELEPTDSQVALRFSWHWPLEPGIYCRVEWKQLDEAGAMIGAGCQVVGHRAQSRREASIRKPICLIPLKPGARRILFSLKNAFHASSASIRQIELLIESLPKGAEDAPAVHNLALNHREQKPIGAVGVIVPDRASLAAGLQEIVCYYDHYRATAEAFAPNWYSQHQPSRTIAQLMSHDQLAADVA